MMPIWALVALLVGCGSTAVDRATSPAPVPTTAAAPKDTTSTAADPIAAAPAPSPASPVGDTSCFLLYELGVGEVRRRPSSACERRFTPASTFKIPHALAALDSGALPGPDAKLVYNGAKYHWPSWHRDHTLASAMHSSVVWYFQRIAQKLGPEREKEYLEKLNYGNGDSSSGLTTFWLGESLLISPQEQQQFLIKLYQDVLPISKMAMQSVRDMLVQPRGKIVNAAGEHPFAAPWPEDAVVSAKTGASGQDASGMQVRWIVGHVRRNPRAWIFVSLVASRAEVPSLAAVDLAAQALREERAL